MSRFVTAFAFAFACSTVTADQAVHHHQSPGPDARKIDTGLGDFRVVFKVVQDCSKSQVSAPYPF